MTKTVSRNNLSSKISKTYWTAFHAVFISDLIFRGISTIFGFLKKCTLPFFLYLSYVLIIIIGRVYIFLWGILPPPWWSPQNKYCRFRVNFVGINIVGIIYHASFKQWKISVSRDAHMHPRQWCVYTAICTYIWLNSQCIVWQKR